MTKESHSLNGATSGYPRSDAAFREIYHSVNDAIFVHDTETGDILDVNQTMCEMYGYTRSEARKLTIGDLSSGTHPYTQEVALKRMQKATAGDPQVFEWHAKRSDGTLFWAEVSMRQAPVDGDQLLLVIVRDISRRKRREQQLQQQNARLEEFASIVSHDLRNPLNVIEGRLELAREECESLHHEAMATALSRMERIVDDVLWLAREGQEIGETEAVSLDETIQRSWDLVADQAEQAKLVYAIDEDEDLPMVKADLDRFRQLLENLFRNAINHAGPNVTVTVGLLDTGFYVEDDGPGIPPETRESIFNVGYTTADDGTGYGLRIVEQVAEAHNWDIQVTEGPEGGARFEITSIELVD